MIHEKWGYPVVVTGAKGDVPLVRDMQRQVKKAKVFSLAGDTSLGELGALYEQAVFVVSGDSGPMHIASAVGTPVVALFGPTDPAAWMPLNKSANALLSPEPLDCRPCAKHDCPLGHHKCLVDLTPQAVFAEVERALAQSFS